MKLKTSEVELKSVRDTRMPVPVSLEADRRSALPRQPKGLRYIGRPEGLLLDLDLGADVRELLLDRERLVLRDRFLDRLGRALDEVLRFLQPEAGHFANDLDDVDLVAADFGQRRGELGLLFHSGRAAGCRAAARRH